MPLFITVLVILPMETGSFAPKEQRLLAWIKNLQPNHGEEICDCSESHSLPSPLNLIPFFNSLPALLTVLLSTQLPACLSSWHASPPGTGHGVCREDGDLLLAPGHIDCPAGCRAHLHIGIPAMRWMPQPTTNTMVIKGGQTLLAAIKNRAVFCCFA